MGTCYEILQIGVLRIIVFHDTDLDLYQRGEPVKVHQYSVQGSVGHRVAYTHRCRDCDADARHTSFFLADPQNRARPVQVLHRQAQGFAETATQRQKSFVEKLKGQLCETLELVYQYYTSG